MAKLFAVSWRLIGLIVLMLVITAAGMVIPDPSRAAWNLFAVLSYAEWAVVVSGALLGLLALTSDQRNAAGVLGLGLYTLALGLVFGGAGFARAGSDNAFLGLLALGGLATLVGAGTSRLRQVLLVAGSAAVFTIGWFLLRGPGDWASASTTLNLFSLPLVVAMVVPAGVRAGRLALRVAG